MATDAAPVQGSLPFETPYAFVRNRRARRYLIRVNDDGSVRVTIPARGSLREAAAFAARERRWIEGELRRVERARVSLWVPPTVERELRRKAARELPARLFELAARFGLTVARVSVREQRSQWGSCSPAGHISLNWRLIQLPAPVSDYVMIHELMHLRRQDHSPRFWKLVEEACPGFEEARGVLRSVGR